MKTIGQLAVSFDRKMNALVREIQQAERKTAEQTKSIFVKMSSGTMTPGQRRLLGYPYAVRSPHPGVDPAYINVITGNLKRSWRIIAKQSKGRSTVSVVNTSKEAQWMLGTAKMVPRRLDTKVVEMIRPLRIANLRRAVQRALRA